MKRVAWLWLAGLLLPIPGSAHGGVDAAKRSVEASMLVTGEIAVNPDGSVYVYSLDQRDKLPAPVVKLIDGALPHWKFTPVEIDGKSVLAKSRMSLRIIAHQTTPGHFVASVEGAAFGTSSGYPATVGSYGYEVVAPISYATRRPPTYPSDLVGDLVGGTVYVVVEVDSTGRLAQAAVRQVDLRRLAGAIQLAHWRNELARVTLAAVRKWTFNVPRTLIGTPTGPWFVAVPVNYSATSIYSPQVAPSYGQWDAYVPGPIQPLPWATQDAAKAAVANANDAISDNGGPFVPDTRFVLLTPLGGDDTPSTAPKATPGQG